MKVANNYVYVLDGKAYINLTNKCSNACRFCIRNTGDGVAGTPLWLGKDPTAQEVIAAFENVKHKLKSDEAVFCGYGEPTDALDVLLECARYFKAAGYKTRLNTNGLGSADAGRDITPLLNDFDAISVSLNAPTAEEYAEITRSRYGLDALGYVVDFAKRLKTSGRNVVFTVVDVIGDEAVAKSRALADALGIPLRVREYISDNYNSSRDGE